MMNVCKGTQDLGGSGGISHWEFLFVCLQMEALRLHLRAFLDPKKSRICSLLFHTNRLHSLHIRLRAG